MGVEELGCRATGFGSSSTSNPTFSTPLSPRPPMENGASVYREVKDNQVIARNPSQQAAKRPREGEALRFLGESWQVIVLHRLRAPPG